MSTIIIPQKTTEAIAKEAELLLQQAQEKEIANEKDSIKKFNLLCEKWLEEINDREFKLNLQKIF